MITNLGTKNVITKIKKLTNDNKSYVACLITLILKRHKALSTSIIAYFFYSFP